MTELEMDFEVSPELTQGAQADEDLIDYDTETEEQEIAQVAAQAQAETKNIVEPETERADRAREHEELDLDHKADDLSEAHENPGPAGGTKSPSPHEGAQEASVEVDASEFPPSPQPTGDPKEEDDLLDMGEVYGLPEKEAAADSLHEGENEDPHEISYDNVDITGEEVTDADEEHHMPEDTSASVPALTDNNTEPPDQVEPRDSRALLEEDEITWTDNIGNGDDNIYTNADAAVDQADHQDHDGAEAVEYDLDTTHEGGEEIANEQETTDHGVDADEDVDLGHDDQPAEEVDGNDAATGDMPGGSPSHEEPSVSADSDFPDIVVQYKGEAFPLFSAGTDGFFSELSVLDGNMETILAGLRTELANEIAIEDELVFQVDEIGLEFSESCARDILCATSMRQILEIFDLLVKNQDPDSTRTLYAYIFTKPSATKRFEYLVESATAGKGLDEVTHLFHASNNASPADTTEAFDETLAESESVSDENSKLESEKGEQEAEEPAISDDHFEFVEAEPLAEAGAEVETKSEHISNHTNEVETTEDTGTKGAEVSDAAGSGKQISKVEPAQILADADTIDASPTETLQNVDEISPYIETMMDFDDDQDELAEIDWRDDPEPTHTPPETPSGTSKRPRTELDVEDEQDVKRRRS